MSTRRATCWICGQRAVAALIAVYAPIDEDGPLGDEDCQGFPLCRQHFHCTTLKELVRVSHVPATWTSDVPGDA